jgi:hypothetical protein
MHRIRFALGLVSSNKLSGEVEADETFIGGKARNTSASASAGSLALAAKTRLPSWVFWNVVERFALRRKKELQAEVRKHVEAGAALYTDALLSYEGLEGDYAHKVVDHAVQYVDGHNASSTPHAVADSHKLYARNYVHSISAVLENVS